MQDFIPAMLELQEFDLKIIELKREQKLLPEQVSQHQKEKAQIDARLNQQNDILKGIQVKKKDFENDIAQRNEQIKKCQTQLLTLKSNKDYRTMDLDIQSQKQKNAELEDRILELMMKIDEQTGLINGIKKELAVIDVAVKAEEQETAGRLKEIENQLTELNEKRKNAAAAVPADALRRYEQVFANKKGLTVVPVKHEVCGGCNMRLTKQTQSTLKKTIDVILCDNCSRILYIENQEAPTA